MYANLIRASCQVKQNVLANLAANARGELYKQTYRDRTQGEECQGLFITHDIFNFILCNSGRNQSNIVT